MDGDKSSVDKIALESSKDVLASLSRVTYILIGLFLPALIVLFSGDDKITLFGLEIAAVWVPVLTISLTYVIILHGCRCLSILEQFCNPTIMTINDDTREAIKVLIKTHEWPFNPLVDFKKYANDVPLNPTAPKDNKEIKMIRWRTWQACVPLLGSFLLSTAYVCFVLPIRSWTAILLLLVTGYILYRPVNVYTNLLKEIIRSTISKQAEEHHNKEVRWIKETALGILILAIIGLIIWEFLYMNSYAPMRQFSQNIQYVID